MLLKHRYLIRRDQLKWLPDIRLDRLPFDHLDGRVVSTRGERRLYIACVEILPNMLNPVLTDLGLRFGFIVLLLSGMSFLGLGVQPPDADLGSLVRENVGSLNQGAPAIVIPALAICTLTIGVNLFCQHRRGAIRPSLCVRRGFPIGLPLTAGRSFSAFYPRPPHALIETCGHRRMARKLVGFVKSRLNATTAR